MSVELAIEEVARKFFLHDPATVATNYVAWARRLKEDPGITWGCILDKHLIPLHPGDLVSIVARPGMGKSSLMAYMAKKEAQNIVKRGKVGKEIVIYVTWEQVTEEIEAFFQSGRDYSSTDMAWGRVPMDTIERKAVQRPNLPVWLIGEAAGNWDKKRPPMYFEYIYGAIEALAHEHGIRPTLICMDYLQLIPIANSRERSAQVAEATFQAKRLGARVGCPILAGVQADRGVDDYKHPIPSMKDAQWSSAIEQSADKQLAIWRPSRTFDPAETPTVKVGGIEYKNDEDLFVIRLIKQRFDVGFGTWAVRFKPQTLEIFDYEYRTVNLNGNGRRQP